MIKTINVTKVEGGYIVDYCLDDKFGRRVFYTWLEIYEWFKVFV